MTEDKVDKLLEEHGITQRGLNTWDSVNIYDVWNLAIATACEYFGEAEGTDHGAGDKFTIE